jgi:hypothetical protein
MSTWMYHVPNSPDLEHFHIFHAINIPEPFLAGHKM